MKKLLCLFSLLFFAIASYAQSQPLPASQVFQLAAKHMDANNVKLTWKILPGYFLYRERMAFHSTEKHQAIVGRVLLPPGEKRHDEELGNYQIYKNHIAVQIPVLGLMSGKTDLLVKFQGCSSSGFCYPPEKKLIQLSFNEQLRLTNIQLQAAGLTAVNEATPSSPSSSIEETLNGHNLALIFLSFLALGLMLAFTPCILPMLPIISSIVVGHGEKITTAKAFRLSLTYVLAMSFTYAFSGMLISTLGSNLQTALQQPWVLIASSLLFVALALSMFGLYELRLPKAFEHKIANLSKKQNAGHYLAVAVMGCLATLIVSPCVSAPLVGVLAFIANTGDRAVGFVALFALGFGMGIPLLLFATSAGKLLPKAGMWMNAVKYFFGVLLLAVAISLMNRVLSPSTGLMLWAALVIVVALFLGAIKPQTDFRYARLSQSLGILFLIYGVIMLTGAAIGNSDPFQPLANLRMSTEASPSAYQVIAVKTVKDVKREVAKAKKSEKPTVLDFYADWCLSCKVIERTTLKNKDVQAALKEFVFLRADVTNNDEKDKLLEKTFGVVAPPTFVFFNRHGEHVKHATVVGEVSAAEFLQHLRGILGVKA